MTAKMSGHQDITIVGAGPAGLACAIALARAGKKVLVREWHPDVGHRFHDDFQGLENWSDERDTLEELAEAGITADFEHHPVSGGCVFDTNGRPHPIRSTRPLFYLLRRGCKPGTLDRALLAQALAAGVKVRFNDRVRQTEGPTVLAAGPRRADLIAVGKIFDTSMENGAWLALGDQLAPRGYSYLLVNQGRGTVASCMFARFGDQAKYLEATLDFFERRAGLSMRNARPFGGYGNVRLPRTAVQGANPVVGEQAGFQDALAGFGLRYAMRSGRLAAESVISGADYTRLWRQQLQPGLHAGVVNRFLFNLAGARGLDRLINKLGDADAGHALGRAYRPGVVNRILSPIAIFSHRAVLADLTCSHSRCTCVRCRNGRK